MKIISKKLHKLDQSIPVYDVTIKDETPCFMLDAGIVSHNTKRWKSFVHTIPWSCELREDFTPRKDDSLMIHFDYSQSEVRIMAAMAGETSLLKVFEDPNADVHRFVASKIYKKDERDVSDAERRFAKMATFSLLYRKGVASFAQDFMKGDLIAAQKFFYDFFSAFPLIKAFIDRQDQLVETDGIVYTMFGDPLRTDTGFEKDEGAAKRHGTNYPIQCEHGDTPIVLLSSNTITVREMANNPGTDYYGWAVNRKTKKLSPVLLENPRITGESKEWIKITLDNGFEFKTTPEHLWIMRNGSEKRADQLKAGDSLMPYKTSTLYGDTVIIHHNDHSREFISQMVASKFIGDCPVDKNGKNHQVHHKDHNRFNNYPDNLEYLSEDEHTSYHCKELTGKITETASEARSEMMTWKNQNKGECYLDWHKNQKEAVLGVHGDKIRKALKEGHNKPESKERHSIASKKLCQSKELRISKGLTLAQTFNSLGIPWNHPVLWDIAIWRCLRSKKLQFNTRHASWFIQVMEWSELVSAIEEQGCVSVPKTSEDDIYSDIYVYIESGSRQRKEALREYFELFMDLKVNSWEEYVKFIGKKRKTPEKIEKLTALLVKLRNNHKVTKVEKIIYDEPQPTYDISVHGYENFAIGDPDDGVFIHNSTSSVVCGHAGWKIYETCKNMNLGFIPLCFTHDSIDAEIDVKFFPLIMDIIKGHAENIPKELGIPAKIDMEVGVCLSGMFELKKISHTGYTYEIKGDERFLPDFIKTLERAFKVSYSEKERKGKVTSLSELFVARRAFSRYLGVEIPHVKGTLTLEPLLT